MILKLKLGELLLFFTLKWWSYFGRYIQLCSSHTCLPDLDLWTFSIRPSSPQSRAQVELLYCVTAVKTAAGVCVFAGILQRSNVSGELTRSLCFVSLSPLSVTLGENSTAEATTTNVNVLRSHILNQEQQSSNRASAGAVYWLFPSTSHWPVELVSEACLTQVSVMQVDSNLSRTDKSTFPYPTCPTLFGLEPLHSNTPQH